MKRLWIVMSNDEDHLLLGVFDNLEAATDCECYWNDSHKTFVVDVNTWLAKTKFVGI